MLVLTLAGWPATAQNGAPAASPSGDPAHGTSALVALSGADWAGGEHSGTALVDGALTLARGAREGVFEVSLPVHAPFDRLLLSLGPDPLPDGAEVRARVRVQGATERSDWLPLGVYGGRRAQADGPGAGLPRSERGPQAGASAWARVDVDVVRLERPARRAALRIELRRGSIRGAGARETGGAPRVRRVAVSLWSAAARPPARAPLRAAWGRVLDVPQRSQQVEDRAIAGRICSPTSLSMVLAFHGEVVPTAEVAAGVYDHGAQLFGNWSFNVAYAATRGLEATAAHLDDLRDLEEEVLAGRPVVISHRYARGELAGAPIASTDGHLIVVVGFTASGDVVVNDPAADPRAGEAIRRVYRRDELRRSWLERAEGVAYRVRPRSE